MIYLLAILAVILYGAHRFGGYTVESVTDYLGGIMDFGRLSIRDSEEPLLRQWAEVFSIDPRFLAALRVTENGGPGRELGILSVPAPTVGDQYEIAARTISNNLGRYEDATGKSPIGNGGVYTDDFIRWFSSIFAPIGASNDPTNLNANHARNLLDSYRRAQG